jgi:hypothetical protein
MLDIHHDYGWWLFWCKKTSFWYKLFNLHFATTKAIRRLGNELSHPLSYNYIVVDIAFLACQTVK